MLWENFKKTISYTFRNPIFSFQVFKIFFFFLSFVSICTKFSENMTVYIRIIILTSIIVEVWTIKVAKQSSPLRETYWEFNKFVWISKKKRCTELQFVPFDIVKESSVSWYTRARNNLLILQHLQILRTYSEGFSEK